MKKILASIFLVLNFAASSGVVLNVHYCMGHIASVKVDDFSLKSGMCDNNESKNDCCRDEIKVLKVDNLHKASVVAYFINIPEVFLSSCVSLIDQTKLISQKADLPLVHAPPNLSLPPSYILNCVFKV